MLSEERANAVTRRDFMRSAALLGAGALSANYAGAAMAETARPLQNASLLEPLPGPGSLSKSSTPLAPPEKQPPELKVPEPKRKVGWAVVGLGELALGQSIPAFRESEWGRVVALVSGHPEKART